MAAFGQSTSTIIDRGHVADLIDAIGIDDFIDIVKTLEHEVDLQICALEARSLASEPDNIKKTAHRLAGLMSQFGAFEVAAHAQRVREAHNGDEVNQLAASMIGLCRASMAAIADLPLQSMRGS